jgi:hypothetical protein
MNKKIVIGSILLVILAIILFLYLYDFGHVVVYDNPDLFYGKKEIYVGSENLVDSSDSVKYTFSVWIKINNLAENTIWNSDPNVPKTIVYNNGSPNIYYLRKENTVRVQLVFYNNNSILENYDVDLIEFEPQVWSNITVTVDNKKVNVYKNGIIYTSKILMNPNLKSYKMMSIGEKDNNFNGYIGRIDYYNYVMDDDKILRKYTKYKNTLPNNMLHYEGYEYLRKQEEIENEQQINEGLFNPIANIGRSI